MRRRGELNRAAAPPPPPSSAVPQTEEEKKQARKTRLSQPIKAKLGYEAASPDAPWYQAKKPQRSYSSKYEQVQNVTTYFEDTASRADDKKPFDPEHQKCRDAFWALLFIAHFLTMCILAASRGLPELSIAASNADGRASGISFPSHDDDDDPLSSSFGDDGNMNSPPRGGSGGGNKDAAAAAAGRGRSDGELMSTGSVLVALISLALASLASLVSSARDLHKKQPSRLHCCGVVVVVHVWELFVVHTHCCLSI